MATLSGFNGQSPPSWIISFLSRLKQDERPFWNNAKGLTYRSNWLKVLISLKSDGWQQRPAPATRQTRRQQARHIDNFVNYTRLGTKNTISWWGLMHMCTFSITSCMLNLHIFLSAVHYCTIAQCMHLTVSTCAHWQHKVTKLLLVVQHVQLTMGQVEAIAYVVHCLQQLIEGVD